MSAVLAEGFREVLSSDVFPHGYGPVLDFLDPDARRGEPSPDWIITNPPFKTALQFAELALARATVGVALLVRSVWTEGSERYARLFAHRQPTLIAQYVERVPMTRARWDPGASSATAYCWVIWVRGGPEATRYTWIPPGRREALSTRADLRFAVNADAPLFGGQL